VVLVLSDHGFQADVHAPTARRTAELSRWLGEGHDAVAELALVGATGTHHPDGVLIAAGGPIVQGADFSAELYDITPTVLALLGLPVAEDMPGRVLSELIDRSFLDRHPVRRIPSYADHLRMTWPAVADGGDDSEALEMLRALEYIE
jgi:arylsulfatase A-like enzyme